MGSREKKRSKKASQGRNKKGGQNSKKKSAKKLPRNEDSYSESEDDSMSSVSSSSYSSEGGVVKRRRSRSRARKDVKRRKKRARSSSSSSDNSSDLVRVKKRKNSKRKVGLGQKKKVRKNYKRAPSLSSMSSDKSDYEKSRGKSRGESKKKEIRRRYNKEEKSQRKMKRNRARSISPSTESSASDNKRKRKRHRAPSGFSSSSSMSNESERKEKRKRYWSPSGSSLSGGSKSSDRHDHDEIEVHDKPIRKLNSIVVIAATPEPYQNDMSKGLENYHDMMDDERSMKSSNVEMSENIEEKKSTTEATALVPGDEDLESILRRKALENLKRFRMPKTSDKSEKITGVKQLPISENAADQENTGGSNIKHSLSSEIGSIPNESDKDRDLNINLTSSSEKEETFASPSVNNKNTCIKNNVETRTGSTKSANCSEDSRATLPEADNLNLPTVADMNSNSGDESVYQRNLIFQPSKSSNVKAEPDTMLGNQEPLAAGSTKGQTSSPQECIKATPALAICSTDKRGNNPVDEVNHKSVSNISKESNIVKVTVPDNPSSLPGNTASEHVSSEHQRENKEDSQFQEKTMTVMRGGELVQVSYKVYIPKKAPAATRRRLNR